ncbi:MAG TPA: hypothetical protein VI072_35505 [Polyangiaceae bacterium]
MQTQLMKGMAAGMVACTGQAVVGKVEDWALLPPWEDANIAPRHVERVADSQGVELGTPSKWLLGTAFHYGYGAFWGAVYAGARERISVSPLTGGLVLGSVIYAITFPRWGVAVQTGTERPAGVRTKRMTLVAASVAISFGLFTAFLYERMR